MRIVGAVALLLALEAGGAEGAPPRRNGFALEPSSVPVREILAGGPLRDGIPALDHPSHAGTDYDWEDDERVVGVEWNGEARAYPLAILVWHELVNDTLGGRPILVSYCPLCGTALVFDRSIDASPEPRRFGVSGLLYRSDMLMYDHETESLWSQISAEAVTGPSLGRRLELLRASTLRWADWRARHPKTRVLTRNTGHARRYGTSPYGDYAESRQLLFPVPSDRRYHPKMPTLGLRVAGGAARAYPAAEVVKAGGQIEERFAGHPVRVAWDENRSVFEVTAPASLEVVEGYWFAWAAFHPDTSVAKAGN